MSAETAAILDKAANVIRRNGWHRGTYFDRRSGNEPERSPVCLVGAIGVAGGGWPGEWRSTRAGRDALAAVAQRLDSPVQFIGRVLDVHEDFDADLILDRVSGWNDADSRTAEDVIAALESAAQAEREAAS